jgi:hypothetical protein
MKTLEKYSRAVGFLSSVRVPAWVLELLMHSIRPV